MDRGLFGPGTNFLRSGVVPTRRPASAGRGPTARGKPLAALRHRDFRILLFSTMALQVGSWVQTIGQGWLVLHDLNGSATSLGLVALLRGGALVVMSPIGGHMASKYERKRQLMAYTSGSAVVAILLAVTIATGHVTLWLVFITAIAAGTVEALAAPIRSILVYDSVAGEDLTAAVALNALGGNAMRVIGPAIGGVLIGTVGTQGAFEVQAFCIVLSLGFTAMLALSHPPAEPDEEPGILRNMVAGFRYVIREPRMRFIVGMGMLPSILVYPYVTFLPVFARDVLNSDESGYGYLAAAVGLGSLAGGTLVAFTAARRTHMGRSMIWTCLLYAGAVGAFTLMRNLWLGVLFLALAGVFHSMYSAYQASLMQLKAEPRYRGRVLALQTTMWGTTPFAAVIMGRMIDYWSAAPVVGLWMASAAGLCVLVAVFARSAHEV
ncbi:MAG: MFS transporter [Thermoflexaceae bacterium]|nr:MFS transporter [Thermoflexaceae bacterium]